MLAQDTFVGPEIQWWHLSPILALIGGALFLLIAGALTPRWPRGLYAILGAQPGPDVDDDASDDPADPDRIYEIDEQCDPADREHGSENFQSAGVFG